MTSDSPSAEHLRSALHNIELTLKIAADNRFEGEDEEAIRDRLAIEGGLHLVAADLSASGWLGSQSENIRHVFGAIVGLNGVAWAGVDPSPTGDLRFRVQAARFVGAMIERELK